MLICVKCRREMHCVKNGFGARWGAAHYYAGDLFKCPNCGWEVVKTSAAPTSDRKSPGVQMDKK